MWPTGFCYFPFSLFIFKTVVRERREAVGKMGSEILLQICKSISQMHTYYSLDIILVECIHQSWQGIFIIWLPTHWGGRPCLFICWSDILQLSHVAALYEGMSQRSTSLLLFFLSTFVFFIITLLSNISPSIFHYFSFLAITLWSQTSKMNTHKCV